MTRARKSDGGTTREAGQPRDAVARPPSPSAALRLHAEEHLGALPAELPAELPADLASVHELRIHKVELEAQNEELRRVQAELDASRAFYLEHYEFAPLGYCTIDASGLFRRANLATATMLGVTPGGFVDRRFSQFVSMADQDAWHLVCARLFGGQGVARAAQPDDAEVCELRLAGPDGAPFWAHLVLTTADEDGVTVCHVVLDDITARTASEEALRASEEQFRAIANYTVDWETWFGTDGRIKWVNPAVERITGYPAAEVVAMPDFIGTLVVTEDRDMFAAALQAALGGTTGNNLEVRCVARDGSRVWLGVSWQPIFDAHGGPLGVRSSARDITERKRTDAAARAREAARIEAELNEAQRLGRTGSWTWDAGTDAPVCSDEMYRIFGSDPAVGPLSLALFAGFRTTAAVDAADGAFADAFAGGGSFEHEVEFLHPDGSRGWALLRGGADWPEDDRAPGRHGTATDITERKHAAEELRRVTDRLALATRAGGVGLWDYDVVTGVLVWDDQMYGLYGMTRDQFSGAYHAWQAGLHPDDRERGDQEFRLALAGERDFDTEFRVVWPDGTVHHIRGLAHVQRDDAGRALHMVGTNWDITPQKLAEEASRESEERYRSVVAAMSEGIVLQMADGSIAACNAGAQRILGLTEDEMLGRTSVDPRWRSVHEDGSPFPGEEHPAMVTLRTGQAQSGVVMGVHTPDGRLTWISVSSEPLRREPGAAPHAAVTTFLDITERKLAADQIARREAELKAAQRMAHVGSWELDVATGVVTWSDEMCRIFGLAPGSPVPSLADQARFFSREAFALMTSSIEEVMATGEPFSTENEIVRLDGIVRHVTVDGEAIRDAAGAVVGVRGTTADVTDARETQARLEEAQRAEMVGRLAGGVAHDFNNHLAAISGYSEILEDGLPPGDPRLDDVAAILVATRRAAALVRQLLAYGRRQALRPTVFDVGEVLAALAPMLRSLIPASVRLVLPVGPAGDQVRVDRTNLEQAIVNLALNARDAMPVDGTLTIEVTSVEIRPDDPWLRLPAGPGPHVRITVTDTGSGIDSAVLPHILEPFFTTRPFGQGSGLGLSGVDGFVAQSGGFLTIESEVGAGTTVSIHLPRAEAASTAVLPPDVRPAPIGGGETILLVDDEPEVLAITARLVRGLGYTVLEAADPAAALAIAETGAAFDLLLTDIVMPGMDGRELAARLTDRYPGLPALFMSGYDPETVFSEGLLDPGLPLLSKPITRATVAARVRELLDAHPATGA